MSDSQSARLGLPYLAAGQMQKHVTLNEAMTRLDVLVQTRIESRSEAEPPATPEDGALYLVGEDATGAWAGLDGKLVRFEMGGWLVVDVAPGHVAIIADEDIAVVWDGAEWSPLGLHLGEIGGLERLGINTTADADNPLAAKLNKALLTALPPEDGGDGDLRLTLNKTGAADVGSLLFQSGYGGRAELGLIGSDALTLKVSGDGAVWTEALSVAADGKASFPQGAVRSETTILTASGTWAVPDWAERLEIECVGAGGGGGSGGTGANGTLRTGGAGGGAGAVVSAAFATSDLASSLTVVVAAGGGGAASASGGSAGSAGSSGGASSVESAGEEIIRAGGGGGGAGGSNAAATAGLGGVAPYGRMNAGGGSASTGVPAQGVSSTTCFGAGGGGAGGGLSAADAELAGEYGGYGSFLMSGTRRAARGDPGAASGGAGGSGAAKGWALGMGGGGGGGGAGHATAGGAGGAGGSPGGGGGGGGAGRSGPGSGAGGQGGHGEVRITAIG